MKKISFTLAFACACAFGSQGQLLLSQFNFDNNLQDFTSNSECTEYNTQNASFSGGIFSWEAGAGTNGGGLRIAVPDAIFTEDDFSMAIDFSFSDVSGYRKIVDFSDLQVDQGLYVNGSLRLYSDGNYGPTNFVADSMHRILLTRDGLNDTTRVYLFNGTSLMEESKAFDGAMNYVPALVGADRVFYLFIDDSLTFLEHTSMGKVDNVRIWNGVVDMNDYLNFFGIEELGEASFTGFPNPAQNVFHVRSEVMLSGEVRLQAADGRILDHKKLHEVKEFSFDVVHLPAGVYFVHYGEQALRFVKK
jgi:hypothetical protein